MPNDLDRLAVPHVLRKFAEMHLGADRPLHRIAGMLALDKIAERVPVAELARCALALRRAAPTDRALWQKTAPFLNNNVPGWHWTMVNDTPRNDAYACAIKSHVLPGMRVLEIGTGSGLLAMIAARAGAEHVWTVEKNPVMATVARECIEANGLSHQITVIDGKSTDLPEGSAVPRCDILLHEILSGTVLSEGVIPAVAHAREALLVPGAPLLPERVRAIGSLTSENPANQYLVDEISGFDLTTLGLLGPSSLYLGDGPPTSSLSDAVVMAEFDLNATPANAHGRWEIELTATAAGEAHGLAQWLGFSFPDGADFEALNPISNWGRFFRPFGRSLSVSPGDEIRLEVEHGPDWLAIGLASGSERAC